MNPATTPTTKAAFRRRCQQAIDQQETVTLYAPYAPQGVSRTIKAVRSADIIFVKPATGPLYKHERVVRPDGTVISESATQLDHGRPAGEESYLTLSKESVITNDGPTWTISNNLALTYVFPS